MRHEKLAMAVLALAVSLGGCASVNPVVQTTAAPVSYKLGQGAHSAATVRSHTPYMAPAPRGLADRSSLAERPVAPPVSSEPIVDLPSSPFDADGVDDALYAHMRIGKRYTVFGKSYKPRHQPGYDVSGTASWYGPNFHGKPTASGETFDMEGLSVAHKTLPLNSLVHVTNLETGASMTLRVNDRGPFVGKRIIDLSKAAARELGLLESGLKQVRVRYAGPADPNSYGDAEPVMVAQAGEPSAVAPITVPDVTVPGVAVPDIAADLGEPAFDLDAYKPLRGLPAPDATPSASLPMPGLPGPVLTLPVAPTMPAPGAAPAPPRPDFHQQMPVQPDLDGGPLTLTIKGPIHMATSRTMPGARSIVPASTRK